MKWFFMLSKRLYKKPAFVILLILIPICVFAFSITAKQESGFLHIVLADGGDRLSQAVVNELAEDESIIRFTVVQGKAEALKLVESGKADEAWIFPADTEEQLSKFVDNKADYVVSVVTGEQSVALRLSREKLSAVLYKYCAKAYYIDYIRAKVPELDGFTEEKLTKYFDDALVDEEFFAFSEPYEQTGVKTNYLTSPIRGLLGVLALICAMAAAMFFMEDEIFGTFALVKQKYRGLVAFGCIFIAVLNVSVVILLSLCVSALSGNIFKEIFILITYTVLCAVFSLLLKEIFTVIGIYASIIPTVAVACLGICPVFFDFRSFLQLLLPPTYYVNALYDGKYFFYMLIYITICLLLTFVIEKLKKIKKQNKSR